MHAKLFVEMGVEVRSRLRSYRPTQLNGSLAAMVASLCILRVRKTSQPLDSHGHGGLSRLFDVHARLSHDLFLSLYLDRKHKEEDTI
jgi:hypothetical protein